MEENNQQINSFTYSHVGTLKQQYSFIPARYQDYYLVHILMEKYTSTSMIFTYTSYEARLLALMLQNLGLRAISITDRMTEAERVDALNTFNIGECNILVCTDVACGGLDIPSVDMVINYAIPTNSMNYIHRVRRTEGDVISLVNQYELEAYLKIEKLIGEKLPQFPAQQEEVLSLCECVSQAKGLTLLTMMDA